MGRGEREGKNEVRGRGVEDRIIEVKTECGEVGEGWTGCEIIERVVH